MALAIIYIFQFLLKTGQNIIFNDDSVLFENVKNGNQRILTPPNIEQVFPNRLVLLLKNGQKEIINVKDYTKNRFFMITDFKTQFILSQD
jgi:hypothetical protein